ncbi:hypothetical protein ES332_D11G147100v1 [Gossypium tomentosum]|uniref:Uncharacterized protein n=1 Tax=Gossypium tomentosum TaxID=34277 RepID=A0A5D2IN48_GOSTO|nr:hypothetical protein ES332_D11G147100v1 [Gossypium tomentosum]TYH43725.1 hypothetical protein ES332_D11G147100v1 [Gossypium tomentosum]
MERGFSLNIVSTVISQSTPTCVSKELAERCSGFVTTIVMQRCRTILFSSVNGDPLSGK